VEFIFSVVPEYECVTC